MNKRGVRSLPWRLIGIATAAALASCVVGPDFHQPKPPGTSNYLHPSSDTAPVQPQAQDVQNVSPGPELAGEWWQLFHSAQLEEVVRSAIAASPTLIAANATLAEAREEVTVARGAFLPSASAPPARNERAPVHFEHPAPAAPQISTASVCRQATVWIFLAAPAVPSSSSRRSRTSSAMNSLRRISRLPAAS